ncbi:hypothetical protein A6A06_06020 [Streptomyces sp. CB02923]|nr:hypothetical protein A6A06_06020 [Streptomyces sp. CB02923]
MVRPARSAISSSLARCPSREATGNAASSRARRLRSLASALALAAVVGLLAAWQGGSAGGEVWTGYQACAAAAFAALLVAAKPSQTESGRGGRRR